MIKEQNTILNLYQRNIKLIMTKSDKEKYESSKNCYICNGGFSEDKESNFIKVRDHCHLTGDFRGAAHKLCNPTTKISIVTIIML